MADEMKVDPGKLMKLLEAARALHEKQGAILAELDALLEGKAGIAARMKALEGSFDAAWCARYAPTQTRAYVWTWAEDRANMKRLLAKLDVDEIAARAIRYVKSDDPFYVRQRHPFRLFVRTINEWTMGRDAPADYALEQSTSSCRHVPPCRSDQEHTRRRMADMRATQ